jgi:hypothetical protein
MHTKDRLAEELIRIGLPILAKKAAEGFYDDFLSPLPAPIVTLVRLLTVAGTPDALELAERVKAGEFDATAEEADAWANSPDGQETFGKLIKP